MSASRISESKSGLPEAFERLAGTRPGALRPGICNVREIAAATERDGGQEQRLLLRHAGELSGPRQYCVSMC